jgi:DNA polymerase
MDLAFNGRIYDNLRYYGANTGRWTGLGFQLLNLPRSKVNEEAEELIQSFHDLSVIEKEPIKTAKELVRQMIKAPDGKLLLFGDYSSIEYVFMIWVTKDYKALERFTTGFDQYKDMAVERYKVEYDDVTDDQRYRGKQLILGCGYGLGAKGFIGYCEQYNVYITDEEANESVNAYRYKYKRIVNFWYNCKDAAINAVTYPGYTFKVKNARNVKYKCIKDRNKTRWLQCTLPSGRNIYYNDPEIGEGKFGPELNAMGINPYTKKWMRLKVIPGRLAENISQATCRDILVAGKINLEEAGYKLIGSIYDEVIAEVDENNYSVDDFNTLACKMPKWADGLPVKMESVAEKRYRKL